MNKNQLITIQDKHQESKLRKRKRSFLVKLITYALIIAIIYSAYINFDKIKLFFENNDDTIQSDTENDKADTDTGVSDSESNEISKDNPTEIPNDTYKINSITQAFTEINNESAISSDIDISGEVIPKASDVFNEYGKDAPLILIVHSNRNEAYSNGQYYTVNDEFYSANNNASNIGKLICDTLKESYINAIHIDDIFGSGAIYNSRKELEKAIDDTLKKYPSIKIVLDISRDVSVNDDMTMDRYITDINGEAAAQISLTVGSNVAKEAIYAKNLNLAFAIYNECTNLVYDITVAPFTLSQDIEPLFLKADIGSYANTYDDAVISAHELASALCRVVS